MEILNLDSLNLSELPPPVERYVNRMVAEVMNIVISLGYQNPEEVINAYANHVPMDLAKKDMLFQLLQKLRQAVETKEILLPPVLERARELFGEDFLGDEVIYMMEDKFKAAGVNVEFELPDIDVPYDEAYIEEAKGDAIEGKARLFVRRPEFMIVNGIREQITLLSLKNLFKTSSGGRVNPFGTGVIFSHNEDWYDAEPFAQASMKGGYAMPTKEVIPGSPNRNWDQQQTLLGPDERRREPVETAWDLMLYHSTTLKRILKDEYDWGNARSAEGGRVYVGGFSESGFSVRVYHPRPTHFFLGMCSQK